ncbi:MAG: hypothetical protein DI533_18570 [Cereibacter sphaeroides]|uniref:2'-5' RNA ligase n=1 Tax=Cereibacter sphaeroides TaxID=1063 RepID=A0A2W5TIY6_CERSP|nr:MAG: hypothetical protein DI533_18570 [Cereibacter sphaeroides]
MTYVLAYPEFEPAVGKRIDAFRSNHEPGRAGIVPPHITLVFGLRNPHLQEFFEVCEDAAAAVSEFAVDFKKTEIVYDSFENTHKIFLVCSTGKSRLIELHDLLYNGPNRKELNLDIPYRPHMTVATNVDRTVIENLDVTDIGALPISGTVRSLEVVDFTNGVLRPLRTFLFRS